MANTRRQPAESTEEIHARVHTTRIERLRKLIDLDFDGVISSMIKADSNKEKRSRSSYISQIQSGHRPFTEQAARRIEVDCSKAPGWLDGAADGDLTRKENASNRRIERLRAYIDANHSEGLTGFLLAHALGARRKVLIADLLAGNRYLSKKSAEVIENECGLAAGYLDQE